MENFFKSANIWQSYKLERGYLVHFLCLLAVCWTGAQSARDNHLLACNLPNSRRFKKKLSLTDSAINISPFGYQQPHHTLNM